MTQEINRNNFDEFWLDHEKYYDNNKFIECVISEKASSRPIIKKSLKQAILEHHFPNNTIKRHLKDLDFRVLADELPEGNHRKGNLGEIIASEHLCQRFDYKMPVYKLRYRDSPLSMRGEDVVAFKIENGCIKSVCIGEAKFIKEFKNETVKKSHSKLKTAHIKSYTLSMIRNILDEKEDDLAPQIDDIIKKLANDDFPRENWIFVVSGDKPNDPFEVLRNEDTVINLHVFSLYLENLIEFSEEIYNFSDIR